MVPQATYCRGRDGDVGLESPEEDPVTRTGLLVALATFSVGAILGYLVGASAGHPPGTRAERVMVADALLARDAGPGTTERRRGGSNVPDLPFAPLSAGTGIITGCVTLADGCPLAGVLVRATPRPPGERARKGRQPTDLDLEMAVRRYKARMRFERESRRETTTDEAGRFTLTGIADATYYVAAFLEGHDVRARGEGHESAGPDDVVVFIATAITYLDLAVLLPDGALAERAKITCARARSAFDIVPTTTVSWTCRDPVLQLEPGAWRLTAAGGRDGELRSDETKVVIEAGVAPEAVTLRLEARPGLCGRLVFPPGHPDLEARVHALRVAPGAEVPDRRVLEEGEDRWLGSNINAAYSYVDLEPGTWIVVVSMGKNRVVGRAVLEVTDGMVVRDFEVPPPEPGDFLILRVEAPDGTLLRDVSIDTGYVCRRYSSAGGGEATLLPDGTYRVQHHAVESERLEEGGTYVVEVQSREYGTVSAKYDADETRTLTVRLEDPATLEVRLTGYVGSPHEGSIWLGLSRAQGGGIRENLATPDAEGRYEFGPRPPGEYVLRVGVKEGPRALWVKKVPLKLAAGANVVTVAVPPLHELTVIVDGLGEAAQIGLCLEGGDVNLWIPGKTPTDGRVRFERLPAGRYVVSSEGVREPGQMVVALRGSTTVRFEAQTMNALYVHIRNLDGHLARAGLREGDLVIAINGEEIVNRDQGRLLLATAQAEGTATFTIVRGRARLEVSMDPGK
jgi:hypothetical protein